MRNPDLNDLVNVALEKWAALKKIPLQEDSKYQLHWEDKQLIEKLNESRVDDPSGLTTFMLLRGMAEEDLKDFQFSAYQVVMEPKTIETTVAPMRELRRVLEDPRVIVGAEDFLQDVRDAATAYGMKKEARDKLENLLVDKSSISMIRHDALRSIRTLRSHQFTQGDGSPDDVKINPSIYEFWNINSLLYALRIQSIPGVTLALIRDPVDALHSYFCFAIRNGDTITVLTDQDRGPHPAHKRMTRRPDKAFSRRACLHWFPYQLVEVEVTEDQKRLFVKARTQMVPINAKAVAVGRLVDLEPEQFIWASLVLDLIREKYWKKNLQLPELSYTGEMVRTPHVLVGKTSDLVRVHGYKPLDLDRLKPEDVTTQTTANQWDRETSNFNAWLTERYGASVSEDLLNPVGEEEAWKALPQAKLQDEGEEKRLAYFEREPNLPIEYLEPTNFGTKEELEKDRLWAARMNQAKVIQKRAEEEYEREREPILTWFKNRIHELADTFCDAAVVGTFRLPFQKFATFADPEKEYPDVVEALKRGVGKDWKAIEPYGYGFRHSGSEYMSLGGFQDSPFKYTCHDRPGVVASLFAEIRPTCPEAMASLLQIPVKELPWPLQHWYDSEPYTGNSILYRIDPEDWVINNPWSPIHGRGISFRVCIQLSRIAANERCKKLGIAPLDWKSLEPKVNDD